MKLVINEKSISTPGALSYASINVCKRNRWFCERLVDNRCTQGEMQRTSNIIIFEEGYDIDIKCCSGIRINMA